jgi:predicted nuclease with TOPRIM domain
MKKSVRIALIIIALAVAVILIFGLRVVIKDRQKIKGLQVQYLNEVKDKEMLKKDKEILKAELESKNNQLELTTGELNSVKQKLALSEDDNSRLMSKKQELDQRIAKLEDDLKAIEAKLHSLPELRKFVRQVKVEIHEEKVQEALAHKKIQEEIDIRKLATGNRGFIIKDRVPTYKSSMRIEVSPVQ